MADEMLKNAQPQELESQIGEEDGLKAGRLFGCADSGCHPDGYFCSRSGPLW